MVTSGAAARLLRRWISRETTSFPTPVSPVIKTFASERAASSMLAMSVRIASVRADQTRIQRHPGTHR
jgi:hypothetical protein